MQSQQIVNGNFMLNKAGLTGLSGAATTYAIGKATDFAIAGKAFSKATVAGGATPTLDAITGRAIAIGIGRACAVLWCLDAAGTVKLVAGQHETVDADGNFPFSVPTFGMPSDDLVPFAYSIHKNLPAAGAVFTIGTSNWNTAGSQHVVQDIITLPGRPQQS